MYEQVLMEFPQVQRRIQQEYQAGKSEGKSEGIRKGIQQGIRQGIQGAVEILRRLGYGRKEIAGELAKSYGLTESQAEEFLEQ